MSEDRIERGCTLNRERPFKTSLKVVKENLILEEKLFTSEREKEITLEKIDLEKANCELPFKIDLPTDQKIYITQEHNENLVRDSVELQNIVFS